MPPRENLDPFKSHTRYGKVVELVHGKDEMVFRMTGNRDRRLSTKKPSRQPKGDLWEDHKQDHGNHLQDHEICHAFVDRR